MSAEPPPDAVMTSATNPRRCWNCSYYSFKIFAGDEDSTKGKCFRDFDRPNRPTYYWVDGLMTCPGFKRDPSAD